ncbi:uncharacterized protein FSUBG_4437 [Fusarium subglutinans]|uniref:Uncharacterized protein n=1 Tax=Gibberella subglutinans TaxID=42677 RepID=A0A8H5Q777_GIBSU|nr:uncharacterized protein FSUBG_4437 [Fusarium subglutinans]KAF5608768.1 hypothetical protein FSUBG_4437 [Fusarium subglutinans]
MAGPPTPVSACPLVYLEIRDGANAKAYNSSRPYSAFTLTIEGERPIGSEMGILVLLIHKGKQQVKAGFFASEAIPASLVTVPPQPVSQTHDAMFDTRPRLSSITPPTLLPPNHFQGTGAPPDFSFTTMLNAPLQPSPFSTVPPSYMEQTQRAQSIQMQNYLPGTQMRHTSPVTAQLNPYHMFLERDGTHSHIPRVGSPLRYSFNSPPPPTQSPIGRADMVMPLNMSTTGSHARSLPVRESPEVGSFESRSDVDTKSCDTRADLIKDLSLEPFRQQPLHDQDFRKQMPRPRQLPFDSRAKTAAPYKKPEVFADHPLSSKSASAFASVKAKDGMYKDAECQTTLPKGPKVSTSSHKSSESRQGSSGVELLPWVILSDYNTLKDLNQATTPLVEQFGQDVARGGDAALLAQFYSKQLWARRRDFWYEKLQVMAGGE